MKTFKSRWFSPKELGSIISSMADETEPNGEVFDSGNPDQEYKDEAIRTLNAR